MGEFKGTSGPWEYRFGDVYSSSGQVLPHCGDSWEAKHRFVPESQRDANARLIAAAPELLSALQDAIGALEFSQDFHRDLGNEEQAFVADKLDAAHAAIAKALGEDADQ